MHKHPILSVVAIAAGLVLPLTASAGDRKFTYSYEVTTQAKGSMEIETWVTWAHRGGGDQRRDRFDFRHEFEFGLTDHLQLGVYAVDWRHDSTPSGGETTYQHSGLELIWNLSNPTTDLLGSALYGEVLVGDGVWELEGKLLLQKNVGRFIFVYNAVVEAEWEKEEGDWEKTGVFEQTAGISYQVSPNLSVGLEAKHEIEFEDWEKSSRPVVYVGPNASVRFGRTFATVTALFQATGRDDEADFQVRTIFGVDF